MVGRSGLAGGSTAGRSELADNASDVAERIAYPPRATPLTFENFNVESTRGTWMQYQTQTGR
jgi:hypothetical protein